MTFYVLIGSIILCMVMSVRTLFITEANNTRISMETLAWAVNLYATIMIGYSLIYLMFELQNHSILLENGDRVAGSFFQQLQTAFYFSGMTMFSVGYGDILPIGIGRIIAMTQAFIGYALPSAFLIRTVIDIESQERRRK